MSAVPYADVWVAARPYLQARKNDVHVPLSFRFAQQLLGAHPEADPDIVLPAVILHDVGWAAVDEEAIYRDGFGPDMMRSAIRRAHEEEGARIARELLTGLGYEERRREEIIAIVDGHDTRPHALSRNDELVKDADRLWRFSVTGVSVACDWFRLAPWQYARRLEAQVDAHFTELGAQLARRELAATRDALLLDLLSATVPA